MLRKARALVAASGLVLLALVAATRCGTDKKKKSDKKPAAAAPGSVDPEASARVPGDWDGKSDYAGSSWEVTEE